MDYEEFNKEYKSFTDWWNKTDEFSPKTNELLWGKTQLEGKHADNRKWLEIDQWTGQEDAPAKNPTRPRNAIQPTGFIPDDRVNSPSHYTSGRLEAIDIIEDAISTAPTPGKGMLQAQVLKYILRLWLKDSPVEDAKKAEWYLRRLIASLE